MSLTDEPPAAEDGIEKDPSPTPPTKRRHIEDEQAPEATAIGNVQTGGTKTQQSETLQMSRRRQEDFLIYKALLKKNIYRNSIHVLERSNQSHTTIGQSTFRCSPSQQSMENGTEARRIYNRLLDHANS